MTTAVFNFHLPWPFPDLRENSLNPWYGILVETETTRLNPRNDKTLAFVQPFLSSPTLPWVSSFFSDSLTFSALFIFPKFSLISKTVVTWQNVDVLRVRLARVSEASVGISNFFNIKIFSKSCLGWLSYWDIIGTLFITYFAEEGDPSSAQWDWNESVLNLNLRIQWILNLFADFSLSSREQI